MVRGLGQVPGQRRMGKGSEVGRKSGAWPEAVSGVPEGLAAFPGEGTPSPELSHVPGCPREARNGVPEEPQVPEVGAAQSGE